MLSGLRLQGTPPTLRFRGSSLLDYVFKRARIIFRITFSHGQRNVYLPRTQRNHFKPRPRCVRPELPRRIFRALYELQVSCLYPSSLASAPLSCHTSAWPSWIPPFAAPGPFHPRSQPRSLLPSAEVGAANSLDLVSCWSPSKLTTDRDYITCLFMSRVATGL